MNIIYPHTEDRPQAAEDNIDSLNELGFGIIKELTTKKDDWAYSDLLRRYWGRDDLLIIEQSIKPTAAQIISLLKCHDPCCIYYYKASEQWTENREGEPCYNIGMRIASPIYEILFSCEQWNAFKGQVHYVSFSGTGFLKLSRSLQQKPLDRFKSSNKANSYNGINSDNAIITNINAWLEGFMRFHVHGEVDRC